MTATTSRTAAPEAALGRCVGAGTAGGLAGGLVFGLMMQTMGMMGMVAGLVGSSSVAVGWLVHLLISAFFGAVFGALLGTSHVGGAVLRGLGYGALLWVVGPLLLMPLRMGMPVFTMSAATTNSLIGHLLFGVVLGGVAALLLRRR